MSSTLDILDIVDINTYMEYDRIEEQQRILENAINTFKNEIEINERLHKSSIVFLDSKGYYAHTTHVWNIHHSDHSVKYRIKIIKNIDNATGKYMFKLE